MGCIGNASDVYDGLLTDVPSHTDFALDVADVFPSSPQKDLFADAKWSAWKKTVEARCDFKRHVRFTKRGGVWFLTIWQKSVVGRTLTDIKADPEMVPLFANNMAGLIKEAFGEYLPKGNWCIVTTPKRRHKERNFATLISIEIAKLLNIPFYEDVAECHTRQRMNAVFTLNRLPEEPNIIVFDDFVTTGQTLCSMRKLLIQHGKNLFFVAGINNIL